MNQPESFNLDDNIKKPLVDNSPKSEIYDISNRIKENSDISANISPINEKKTVFMDWVKEFLFFIVDVFLNAVIIVMLVVLIRFYVLSPFKVSGPSMCDTLNFIHGECISTSGEYIIVNKFLYRFKTPQRGDIVIFKPPMEGTRDFYIKRIIGLPGDKIKIQNGEVYIYNEKYPQGFKLKESYLNISNQHNTVPFSRGLSEFEVPEKNYFLLGDNRKASSDSRHCFNHQGGCIGKATPYLPFENIEGLAWVVLWPFDNVRRVQRYDYKE